MLYKSDECASEVDISGFSHFDKMAFDDILIEIEWKKIGKIEIHNKTMFFVFFYSVKVYYLSCLVF